MSNDAMSSGFGSLVDMGVAIGNMWMQGKNNAQNRALQEKLFNQQLASQKEFAQNSIQWRVADAKKSGIHPLFALGANGSSYTPMDTSGFNSTAPQFNFSFENAIASYFDVENRALQNKLLESQIESQNLSNKAFAGQQSNQQNKINEGISVKSPSAKVSSTGAEGVFIPGVETKEDFKQQMQDFNSDGKSWLSMIYAIDSFINSGGDIGKIDWLETLVSPGLVLKDGATLWGKSYGLLNRSADKALSNVLDEVFKKKGMKGINQLNKFFKKYGL